MTSCNLPLELFGNCVVSLQTLQKQKTFVYFHVVLFVLGIQSRIIEVVREIERERERERVSWEVNNIGM